ncbi:ATP-binding protein [Parapedobacter tibetensis]|uniref:ATP-binding protein n=1 Tax=Parapedobacter tibetensis TaxID=2972951 RepID=UPI00214D8CEE|nr:ATP-binding protein [Parapedobacter tibetensis]
MRRKYPIGLQSFRKIREGDYLYIDKTELIHELVTTGNYYFLSRPRRFGKSLLVDTIDELFSGNHKLFEGLWIADHWDWEQKNPVIHLRISQIDYQKRGLYDALSSELNKVAEEMGLDLLETDLKSKFRELIEKAAKSLGQVVILVDEYDKPIIDYLDDPAKVKENRAVFKSFYSVLKDADRHIRFLFLTGVSRFSKVSIFSDLNNLQDITVGRMFNALVGITQQELETNFVAEIRNYADEMGVREVELIEKVRQWYNGYSWGGRDTLYNPFSLLSFMKEGEFRNYWFATGSPTFLVNGIRARGEYDFERVSSTEHILGNFDPLHMLSIPLLFQTGYLTIKEYNPNSRLYELGYPNQEVKDSLLDNLLSAYRGVYPDTSANETGGILLAIQNHDIPGLIDALNAVIASIPYDHWRADTESIFHIIMLLTFQKVGVDVGTEVHSSKGRCDLLVQTDRYIYVIELKLDGTAEEALQQVLDNGYLTPYTADSRQKTAIGISFSSQQRNVADYSAKEC